MKSISSGKVEKYSPTHKQESREGVDPSSGLGMAMLSAIAIGEDSIVRDYLKQNSHPSRKLVLSYDMVQALTRNAEVGISTAIEKIRRARRVSMCFVLDTTRSMQKYINGVKAQILVIVNRIKSTGSNILGISMIGYTDWCNGSQHYHILPFTTDVSAFQEFVRAMKIESGDDIPEDVLGALDKAVKLDWPDDSGTRFLFHLADAPPHGTPLYHDFIDNHPGGHPEDPSLVDLFRDMKNKNIQYNFGRINDQCDKMLQVFEEYYGEKIPVYSTSEPEKITDSVVTGVADSVAQSSLIDHTAGRNMITKNYELDPTEPDWSALHQTQVSITYHVLPESVNQITSFERIKEVPKMGQVKIATKPFAKGSVRLAYYGQIIHDMNIEDMVFKEFLAIAKVDSLNRQRYIMNMETQTVSSFLASQFDHSLSRTSANPNIKVKFLKAKLVRVFNGKGSSYFMMEKRFKENGSQMTKYTSNLGFTKEPSNEREAQVIEVATAFSHFSYQFTNRYCIVCDLQGVLTTDDGGAQTLLLTDPAIHCTQHLRFGATNLQMAGIKDFFAKHTCNRFCRALGLSVPNFDDMP